MILKRFCYLHGPCSITVCLNHTYHFDTGRKFRFIKIEIVHHCIQIYLQYRFVNPFLNQCRNLLKMIFTCTFYQNELVVEVSPNSRLNKCFGRRKNCFSILKAPAFSEISCPMPINLSTPLCSTISATLYTATSA